MFPFHQSKLVQHSSSPLHIRGSVFVPTKSSMKMTFATRRGTIILIQTFLCSLLSVFMAGQGTASDIFCLKSIKDSLEDPPGYLSSSWDFNNNTEGFICRFNGVQCWHPDENRVLNLKLSNMGLKGEFPRGLENCTSLNRLRPFIKRVIRTHSILYISITPLCYLH